MGDDAALQFESGVGGVLDIGVVALARLVPAFGDVDGAVAAHCPDRRDGVVEHIAPVAQHIEDDAAALGLPVVPRRPLGFLPVALEHPVAELAAHRKDAAEESRIAQHAQLEQARQAQLVVDHAALMPLSRAARAMASASSRVSATAFQYRCPCRHRSPSAAVPCASAWLPRRRTGCRGDRRAPRPGRSSSARCRWRRRARTASLCCVRPGSGRATRCRRCRAGRRLRPGSRRSSAPDAGWSPCAR